MKTIFLITIAAASGLMAMPGLSQTTVIYTSPLADYQPMSQPLSAEKVSSWKAANDTVGHIGGWRAYAKEAQQPDNMPTAVQSRTPSTGNVTPVNPNEGHKQ